MPIRTPTPIPVPAGMASVVLFGGTFDPVHLGHVTLADEARQSLGSAAPLVFVPAARSPHKADGPTATDADRVRMLALATSELTLASVWTEEIDRAGLSGEPSYWVDTLETARGQLGADFDLRFIIGSDQLLALPRWHRWQEILMLAEPIVLAREPHTNAEILLEAMEREPDWNGFDRARWAARIVPAPVLPFSATNIRLALHRGDADVPGLDPRVRSYIADRKIYA